MPRIINCRAPGSGFKCYICQDPQRPVACEDCPDCNINLAAADDATWD